MGNKRHKKIHKKGLPPGTLVYTGHRVEKPTLALSVWYNESEYAERENYVREWRSQDAGVFWADVRSLTDTALVAQIGSDFNLHPLALEDVLNTQQRSKMEEYDDFLFFIVHNFRLDMENLELYSEQIAIFMGPRFVVSFQEDPDDNFQAIRKRIQEGAGRLRKKSTDYLTYTILDTVIDQYYLVLEDIETKLQELEGAMYANGVEPVFKGRIYDLKRVINQFRQRVLPLRDAITRFHRSECAFVEESNRPYLRDLADHVAQILDAIDNYRELLAGVEAYYQAEVSNRLNNVMRLLTIISTIFIPLSFIAGVYGMNFDNMPELHWQYGYFIILVAMFSGTLGMLVYFRRKKWL